MTAVIDLFARRIVGWPSSLINDAHLVTKALRVFSAAAISHRGQNAQ